MQKYFAILTALFGALFSFEVKAQNFAMEDFYLDNGLQVIVIENHKAPIVKQMLFYKVGAADEKAGQKGIAHLLEHMMFRGTDKVEKQTLNKVLEENGAESNAFTAQDVTAYHQFLDVSRLELAMFLEADRMRGLAFDEDTFVTERDIVFQERKQVIENNPAAKFFENLNKILWQEHPYGTPITGYDSDIAGLSVDDAKEFYNKYYAPNNAVLVLSGDIDVKTAKELAEKYYGNIKATQTEKADYPQIAENYKARLEMSLPDVKLKRFVKIFVAPSLNHDADKVYALELLSQYLCGDENAPLYQDMVVKDKAALSIDTGYDGVVKSYGSFVISAVPADINTDEFEAKLLKSWQRALKNLTEEKLNLVKRKLLADMVYLKDNPETLAQITGRVAAVGGSLEYVDMYAEKINEVSFDEVRQVAEDLWQKAPQVTGILYPEETVNE